MPLSLFHLHGDLKDLRFPRLLAALREDGFTGVFQATTRPAAGARDETDETTREVHFSSGHIAWAISTERDESLRAYLLRTGTVTETRWAEAEEKAREGTLRQALLSLNIVNPRELTQIEKGRAEEIVLALFSAREGEYRVRERQLSPGTPDLKIDPRPLILKGVLERGDRALILDEVGSLDTVYVVKRPALEEPGLSLPGEFQSVLRHVDGKRSIAQICSLTSMPDNFVCSVFAALSMIGAVRRNYEKTQARPRGEIVKGAEVAASQEGRSPATAPAPASPPPPRPLRDMGAQQPAPARREPPVQEPLPAPAREIEVRAEAEPAAVVGHEIEPPPDLRAGESPAQAGPEPLVLPPISHRPFPGEGPIQTLDFPADAQESEDDEPASPVDTPAARRAPEPVPIPSAYADTAADTSRPWFLLGGAAAVGFAALFLILMGQNPGDAGEVPRPVSEAALEPSLTTSVLPPAEEIEPGVEADGAPPEPVPVADVPAAPAEPDSDDTPETAAPPAVVATPMGTNIFRNAPSGERAVPRSPGGRESLASGDYLAASRYFGREVSSRAGQYTIQLLTACQDETVRRAVDNARGSSRLFILSTRLEGRNCYRVFWGRYPSPTRAREALRREVPSTFLQDRNQPRITRIGG